MWTPAHPSVQVIGTSRRAGIVKRLELHACEKFTLGFGIFIPLLRIMRRSFLNGISGRPSLVLVSSQVSSLIWTDVGVSIDYLFS
jgi:hypothetical protein